MFFKIGVLKKFAILFNKVAGLLLQNTYSGCFWIFMVGNAFFQLNLVFIADSRTGFCFRKHKLNLRSSHWNCSLKKVFLEVLQISKESFFSIELQADLLVCNLVIGRLQEKCFPMEFTKFLRTPNLKSANDCF